MVASFTDAWIETRIYIRSKSKAFVASFTDAWIETFVLRRLPYMTASRIFYRCVDWNAFALVPAVMYGVASFTDAWIETFNPEFDHIGYQVASFTDAWIETGLTRIELLGGSRIFYRCVDWNLIWQQGLQARKVASFTDAWIETKPDIFIALSEESHLLQMRGLKLK